MDDQDYMEWEKKVEKAQAYNSKLINAFRKHLEAKSLSSKTINDHIFNIDFFANDFLLRYEIIPIEEGYAEFDDFLGDYFIKKTSWGRKNSIKQNIVTFNKFYTFLYDLGKISESELIELRVILKLGKDVWLQAYDDFMDYCESLY